MLTNFAAGVSAAFDSLTPQSPAGGKDKIATAARDFEALLIGQLFKAAHGEGGWLGTDDDDPGEAAIGMSEEQLAQAMAAGGGIGLAKMIEAGLRARSQTNGTEGSGSSTATPERS
jgi:Rod binding domain-containing protein